jgi:hypothetical protein
MSLQKVRAAIVDLTDKINLVYQERDEILHLNGKKISSYYDFQKQMWKSFYPYERNDEVIRQRPNADFQSEVMIRNYAILWDLQRASAPFRLRLATLKTLAKAYESERNKLILERQDLEDKPQHELDF